VLAKGFNALHFVAALSSHFRDLAVAKSGALDALLELPSSLKEKYAEQASRCSLGFIYEALGVTTACETAYKSAVNPRLHIEFALMKLSFLNAGAPKVVAAAPAAQPAPAKEISPRGTSSLGRDDKKEAPALGRDDKKEAPAPAISSAPTPVISSEVEKSQVEAPAPRRRAHKTGSALSMNAILEEKEVVAEEKAEPAEVKLPSDEDVRAKWKDMALMYAAKPRLASMLSNAEPRIEEEDGVKKLYFSVVNESQKTWIEEKLLRDMEKNLRDKLGCTKVNILVEVTPDTEVKEKVPYMPVEKAKDLMEKNPNVRELVTALSLDTK
jgi:DNA polymerase-3 subunit gamma/tau